MCPPGRDLSESTRSTGGTYERQQTVRKRGVRRELVAPAFSRVAGAADDTIKIGMVLSVSGPGADAATWALAGAKIAVDRVNKSGGVLGKPIELVTEDDQTTNPGAVLAFSKLAGGLTSSPS
jgi:ABC-type branched-subunit amino acid transport system substrate-binding protein